jgi:hypothetical protein
MHSNFITPPDLVESVLIIDATEKEILTCAEQVKITGRPFNVYFYNNDMKDYAWLTKVVDRVDTVLLQEDSQVPVLDYVKFGPAQFFKEPAEYFNK